MDKFFDFSQLGQSLSTAQTIFIFLPQKLDQDKVAAGLSFCLSLKKAGKRVSCYCPKPMIVEYSSLVGVDKIKQKLEGKNLTIILDIEESIEKVSYDTRDDKVYLFIQPKNGFSPPPPEKIKYSYSGSQADLLILVGISSLEELGEIYLENKNLFEPGKIFNIGLNEGDASYSEVVAGWLNRLKLPVDEDIASNLLLGIEKATNIFSSPKVGAGTFEAAAFCLRAGGHRPGEKIPLKPMSEEVSAKTPPKKAEEEEKPSADWLGPKIYKGNTLI